MRIVLIGSGGRDHALALKLAGNSALEKLFVIPGNSGTRQIAWNIPISIDDHDKILSFCMEHDINLVIVGPEKPLTDGLADKLREGGLRVFGPSKNAARIEGEKSFAKRIMKEYKIPTAGFEIFDKENYEEAINYLHKISYPTVIKADGIAAGKGVIIAETFDDAREALKECFINCSFGSAGDKVVIEEFMSGQEASIFAITDGKDFLLLPAAQDHKRIFDEDRGRNTGGMGAYAPTPFVSDSDYDLIADKVIEPLLKGLREEGAPFIGCLYCGLMMTDEGPKVVEFNCRFGDPETQVVMPLLDGDFIELLNSSASGRINKKAVRYNGGASVCVVASSKGYPGKYEKGFEICGLENLPERTKVYFAGIREENGKLFTDGGRVLNITSFTEKNDLREAKRIAYEALKKISFEGMHYRLDISDKALK